MSDFVGQCRQEWKRLGVPDLLAEEMAADLASDLSDAEADGLSAEEFLGGTASDPRSFAASWAAERGVIPEAPLRDNARRRPLALMTFTALAAIALIVAGLLLLTGEPKVTLTATRTRAPYFATPPSGSLPPGAKTQTVVLPPVSAAAPIEWMLLFLAVVALCFAAWLWSRSSHSQPPSAPA
jgi:hypothetical protein